MSQKNPRIRILLLQARYADDPARGEEVESFAERCGLDVAQIEPWDLLQGPPTLAQLAAYDALMVGGSGDFYVSKGNLPSQQQTIDFLLEVVEKGHPTFASCFGFQCLVLAAGGEIIYDVDAAEVGTFEMILTEDGRRDELFGHLPDRFLAQLGHKDRAAGSVAGLPTLAFSDKVPVEALRVPGKPIWATQFHPELTGETNLGRYKRYLDGYAAALSPEELEESLKSFRESPATMDLLERFVRLVFG